MAITTLFMSKDKKAAYLAGQAPKKALTTVPAKSFSLNPFKTNASRAKLHPAPAALPRCCEKRLEATAPVNDETPMVVYKVVNWAALRQRQTATVGYKHVPFTPLQNAYHRALREDGMVLESIPEEGASHLCECCQIHKLNRFPPCVSVTVR
ncbi:Aste57867_131 [Aphanomyces stellatus]|uniref:Aste57867_131 protein n=1 Tax=Aphanomyces stellatus TaxID=120398 RepID=A0A485K2A2_9STRA|nr:hypothetical protein As57867_000131 [Aphanomyces stellatus]VFT77357.1 Aste57867_131 [Aphanomyces stellatus]